MERTRPTRPRRERRRCHASLPARPWPPEPACRWTRRGSSPSPHRGCRPSRHRCRCRRRPTSAAPPRRLHRSCSGCSGAAWQRCAEASPVARCARGCSGCPALRACSRTRPRRAEAAAPAPEREPARLGGCSRRWRPVAALPTAGLAAARPPPDRSAAARNHNAAARPSPRQAAGARHSRRNNGDRPGRQGRPARPDGDPEPAPALPRPCSRHRAGGES